MPNRIPSRRRVRGFTLVEMMIALAAGLIVSGAVVAFLLSSMKSNGQYVQSTRLTQELRNTLDLLTRDLSRAGYNDLATGNSSVLNPSKFAPVLIRDVSPFVTAGTPATYANADTAGCVIYAYDRTYPIGYKDDATCDDITGCGIAGTPDLARGEIRGLRLACVDGACDGEADDVGVIEFAESAAGVTPTCTGSVAEYGTNPATCDAASGWCPLSDPKLLNITRFNLVNMSSNIATTMQVRDIGVHLEGTLVNGGDFTRAVSTKVKIRADCIATAVANCNAAPAP